jgi:hypothetical protein
VQAYVTGKSRYGACRDRHKPDAGITGIGHNDESIENGDASRGAEARGRANAVEKAGAASARERRDNAQGRHEPDAVARLIGHDKRSAPGDNRN